MGIANSGDYLVSLSAAKAAYCSTDSSRQCTAGAYKEGLAKCGSMVCDDSDFGDATTNCCVATCSIGHQPNEDGTACEKGMGIVSLFTEPIPGKSPGTSIGSEVTVENIYACMQHCADTVGCKAIIFHDYKAC